jgi:hypothetical protein
MFITTRDMLHAAAATPIGQRDHNQKNARANAMLQASTNLPLLSRMSMRHAQVSWNTCRRKIHGRAIMSHAKSCAECHLPYVGRKSINPATPRT